MVSQTLALARARTHTHLELIVHRHDDVTRIYYGIIFTECDIDLPADPSPLGGRRTPSNEQHREEEKTHTHDNDDTCMYYVYGI